MAKTPKPAMPAPSPFGKPLKVGPSPFGAAPKPPKPGGKKPPFGGKK